MFADAVGGCYTSHSPNDPARSIILRATGFIHTPQHQSKLLMIAPGLVLVLALAIAPAQGDSARRESEAHFARGVEFQQKGEFEGARAEYEAALKLVPRRPEALSNLGVVYARLGRYDEAIRRYAEALALDPQQHATRLNLGIAHFQTGHFE